PRLASGQPADLEQVRAAIRAEGLQWEAGETSVSRLDYEEWLARIAPRGAIPPWVGALGARASRPVLLNAPPAAAIDWRDYRGFDFVTAARDQGGCGSCWAFAMLGALEPLVAFRRSTPSPDLDLSEQQLVDCASTSLGCDSGGLTWGPAAWFLSGSGVTTEDCYPYTSGSSGQKGSCTQTSNLSAACRNAIVRTEDSIELSSTTPGFPQWDPPPFTLSSRAMTEIKTLLQQRPIGVSMRTYDDFRYYRSGIYEPSATARISGMHAVALVGYDDAGGYWIAKNSWGDDWGENGFFRIRYNTSSIGMWAFAFEFEENREPLFCDGLSRSIVLDGDNSGRAHGFVLANCGAGVLSWTVSSSSPSVALYAADGRIVTRGDEVAAGSTYRVGLTGPSAAMTARLTFTGASNGPKVIEVTVTGDEPVDAGVPGDAGAGGDAGMLADSGIGGADSGLPLDSTDAGANPSGGDEGESDEEGSSTGGCGCGQASATAPGLLGFVLAAALACRRGRREG
ncbi:MAG: C1 family peptidase, partial [Myxococcales bacterium]